MKYKLRADFSTTIHTTTAGDSLTITLKAGSVFEGHEDSNSYTGNPGYFDAYNLHVPIKMGSEVEAYLTVTVPSGMIEDAE